MKKVLLAIIVILFIAGGLGFYFLSGAGDLIKQQIEQQGSKYLGTQVTVFSVDLSLSEGRLSINDVDVENPQGFSQSDAFSLGAIVLDIGGSTSEPYVVQEVSLVAPEILYELDANGKGNLLVLNENLQSMLPKNAEQTPPQTDAANPLVIVEQVKVEAARLQLNFENLPTGDIELKQKAYEVTLPTFMAGSIGKPNGIPADQVGAAIAKAMLDNVLKQAKQEAKAKIEEEAKARLKEKVEEKTDELKKKAGDKLKDLLNR